MKVKDCEGTLALQPSRCVAFWTVLDITWKVWVAKMPSQQKPGTEVSLPWPQSLIIFATMEGRNQLSNYELCLDKVPYVATPEEEEDIEALEARLRATLSVRSEIIQRVTFARGENLLFPIQNPGDWLNEKGELVFTFKVRPLTYQQKCIDQEIYYQNLLNRQRIAFHAQKNSNVTDVAGAATNVGSRKRVSEEPSENVGGISKRRLSVQKKENRACHK